MKDIIISLIGLAGTIVTAIVGKEGLKRVSLSWNKKRSAKHFSKYNKIQRDISSLRYSIGAKRVSVMSIHNGGGKLKRGKHVYSSILFESHNEKARSIFNDWQQRRCDADYRKIISQLLESNEGYIEIYTKKMSDGSQLKDIHIANKVALSVKFFIKSNRYQVLYMSVNFPDTNFGPVKRSEIESCISRIEKYL